MKIKNIFLTLVVSTLFVSSSAFAKAAIHVYYCGDSTEPTGFVDDNDQQGAVMVQSYNLTDHVHIADYDDAYPSANTGWKEVRCHSAAACQIHLSAGKYTHKLSRVDNGTRIQLCYTQRSHKLVYNTNNQCPSECTDE